MSRATPLSSRANPAEPTLSLLRLRHRPGTGTAANRSGPLQNAAVEDDAGTTRVCGLLEHSAFPSEHLRSSEAPRTRVARHSLSRVDARVVDSRLSILDAFAEAKMTRHADLACQGCGRVSARDQVSTEATAFTCSICLLKGPGVDENPFGHIRIPGPENRSPSHPKDQGLPPQFPSTSQKGGRPAKSREETRRRKREWMRQWRSRHRGDP